ncbi:hypothetical protein AAVH_37580 [Aphelenchoides avenae]|nr:hypothetical protein AAVH_37580 [Aphelenchus avenae]
MRIPFDAHIDADFPLRAPVARGLYNIPRGHNLDKAIDEEFRAGYRRVALLTEEVPFPRGTPEPERPPAGSEDRERPVPDRERETGSERGRGEEGFIFERGDGGRRSEFTTEAPLTRRPSVSETLGLGNGFNGGSTGMGGGGGGVGVGSGVGVGVPGVGPIGVNSGIGVGAPGIGGLGGGGGGLFGISSGLGIGR